MNRCLLSLLDKRSSFFRLHDHIPCEIHCCACSYTCAAFMSTIFLVPVEHDNGMSISSGDVVCVLPTYVHCRLYPAATVFGAPGTRHPIHTGFVQLARQVFRHQNQDSICKCMFVSRPHNISGFEDCWGIAAKFELEDIFQLIIPSSCCDEPLKQQLWIDLYCFIVDFDC